MYCNKPGLGIRLPLRGRPLANGPSRVGNGHLDLGTKGHSVRENPLQAEEVKKGTSPGNFEKREFSIFKVHIPIYQVKLDENRCTKLVEFTIGVGVVEDGAGRPLSPQTRFFLGSLRRA